ncbi:MAG: DNA translocase FtsK 4TM domain-containing protein [Clostridia bacterium]|nr:DNA translocase FtsK 4TM domain-containing protein [Clostridia bacterium]
MLFRKKETDAENTQAQNINPMQEMEQRPASPQSHVSEDKRTARARARMASEDARAEEAEHRLASSARQRKLREAQEKEREEQKRAREDYRAAHPGFYDPTLKIHSVFSISLTLLSLFVLLSFILREQVGVLGAAISRALLGCFSYAAFLLPIFMLLHAYLWRRDVRSRMLVPKALAFIPVLCMTAALVAILSPNFDPEHFDAALAFTNGNVFFGGGAVGGAIGYFLHKIVGLAGTILIALVLYVFFGALYCRDLVLDLYAGLRLRLKEVQADRAKVKSEERAARREEKSEREAAQRARRDELAALREEEKHKQKIERIQAKNVQKEQKKEQKKALPSAAPAMAPKPAEAAVPAKPATPAYEKRREENARRRALFTDFEQPEEKKPTPPTRTPASAGGEVDFSEITHRVKIAPSSEGKRTSFGLDHDFSASSAPAAAPEGGRAIAASPAPSGESLSRDPMMTPCDDLEHDDLTFENRQVHAVRVSDVTEEEEPEIPDYAEGEEEGGKKTASSNSALGKLFARAKEKAKEEQAAARAAKEAAASEEASPKNNMDYFRSITVTAGKKEEENSGDVLLSHPDITPLPTSGNAPFYPQSEIAFDDTDAKNLAEGAPAEQADRRSADANPFHPRNNPSFTKTDTRAEQPRYEGVLRNTSAFTPTSALRADLAAAEKARRAEAATPARGRIVQEKMDVAAPKKPPYQYPPLSLLAMPEAMNTGDIEAEVLANADKLVTTLKNFKVNTCVTGYSRGPRITRYEVVPDAGVRVRNISALVDDISMSLATTGIRIEAPIPGKSAVGVEVPNSSPTLVRLRSMLDTEKFRSFPEKTVVCLGSDVAGHPVYCDLAKMPHLLVAGATGMGKSVCINSIITSILYKAAPDEVKLIMIDPKKVEFSIYAGIPHLLVPVVSDPKKAAGALSWSVNEMERRYSLFEQMGVRDIKGYNRQLTETGEGEPLPKIIIIIDELADLMTTAGDSVETSIARIAAKARAAGIHLLIGTQRPSVDVITGTIKNNIASRIAFHVTSQVDSRTILDMTGAEKLLAHGDMLYAPAGVQAMRVQGAFVDEKEIERVVSFLKSNNEIDATAGEEIMADIEREAEKCTPQKKGGDEGGGGANIPTDNDDGHMLWAALEIGFEYGKLATSLLQRKLSIGYGKAAKILDTLEEKGFVSAQDGPKPREILISREEFKEMMAREVEAQCGDNFK